MLSPLVLTLPGSLGGCASPTPVGLYGARPETGDWLSAHQLTERAREMLESEESDRLAAESLLPAATAAVLLILVGCHNRPPSVGLYGAMPASGDCVTALQLTIRAEELLSATEPDLVKAEELLRRAIEADPAHGSAYLQLGLILEQRDKFEKAIRAYAWAVKLMPGHPEAEIRLRDVLDRLPHHDASRTGS